MTASEKLSNPEYMACVHKGHLEWWKERLDAGELEGRQKENALDMMRIHRVNLEQIKRVKNEP